MEVQEALKYRLELINESKDIDGFISESNFLNTIMPSILDAKLIDTEDFNESYYLSKIDGATIKINGYIINDSGERLQLFIMNGDSIASDYNNLEISTKEYYEAIFKKAITFTNKAIKGHLNDIQDIGAINALISQLSSSSGLEQFDVIEIFVVSATATVENRGQINYLKRLEFKDEKINVTYAKNRETIQKEILIFKKLIDLNFLYNVLLSQGNREVLTIDFEELFNYKIEAIKAADEANFESYLCVLPGQIISDLYRRYSSRLLEKNVRSFLQFRGVNAGMRKTLTKSPEKFIAYNNGLTITASNKEIKFKSDKIFIKSLSDFQIVNGGQTTASIFFSQKDGIDISKVKVMAKINVAKNVSEEELNDLISSISEFSNSQSKVTTVDLRSRNPQLNKIKALSESIVTPSGRKWFFEKSKGEFNTKLKMSGKNRIEKDYPKEFRFTKEQLGKYYASWGCEPYNVKKGGEAIFRKFLEEISQIDELKKLNIDRNFYELLISKIILFKSLEGIYGAGNNSLGQLRSAVVPYTISIIFNHTEGNKKNANTFDLQKIWIREGLDDDLKVYLKELMILVNSLVTDKRFAKSDDFGEYSKKKELWDDIYNSKEITDFLGSNNSLKIFTKYSISKKDLEKRLSNKNKIKEVNFKYLTDNIEIHSKTAKFFKDMNSILWDEITDNEKSKLSSISVHIQKQDDLPENLINFYYEFINKVKRDYPDAFEKVPLEENNSLLDVSNYIILKYNKFIETSEDIESGFEKIMNIAKIKEVKFYPAFSEIGKALKKGNLPTVKQIYQLSFNINKLI